MSLFGKIKEKRLAIKNDNEQTEANEVVVAVPDIKEYLVAEYNRVNDLKLINEGLQQELEKAKKIEIKYDATLVTLDEYSKRLKKAEAEIKTWEMRTENARTELKSARDEINSYKIKFTNAAITKEEITNEIVEEVKTALISEINGCKGNLSKKIVCDIIRSYFWKESVKDNGETI